MTEQNQPNWVEQHKSIIILASIAFWTMLIVVVVIGHTGSSSPSSAGSSPAPTAKYTASLADNCSMNYDPSCWGNIGDDVEVINPADLRIFAVVKNTGSAPGTPNCNIQAEDASYTYTGFDLVTDKSALQPGATSTFSDDITITKQGAQYVTQITIDCHNS